MPVTQKVPITKKHITMYHAYMGYDLRIRGILIPPLLLPSCTAGNVVYTSTMQRTVWAIANPCSQLALSANLIVQDGPDRWPVEGGARFRGVRIWEVSPYLHSQDNVSL